MPAVAFTVEWFDANAQLVRSFKLTRYEDATLELINVALKQAFLKRTYCPDIQPEQLFLGATITVFSRQLHLTAYGDEGTRLLYEARSCRPCVLVKPQGISQLGQLLGQIRKPFAVVRCKMVQLPPRLAGQFGSTTGAAVAIETSVTSSGDAADVEDRWRDSLAVFGSTLYIDVGPPSGCSPLFEEAFACPSPHSGPPDACTVCLVKPHAVQAGTSGEIIADVINESGLSVSALELVHLSREQATEFFKVYRGVLVEYPDILDEMCAGPCVYMQLEGPNAVEEFREMCGPNDVEVARLLRPKSLRARFGADRVKNAVHCTDLPEDGGIECSYMRQVLSV